MTATLTTREEVAAYLYKGGAHMAETRSSNLFRYFGWQGGTIHQISEETGVSVDDLLYGQPDSTRYLDSKFTHGACASETCGLSMRLALAKEAKGLRDFWIGVGESRPQD